MIVVKHFMEQSAPEDGPRLWVEPIGLTLDLLEWCRVDLLLREFAPPPILWEWFDERPGPGRYQVFRRGYRCFLLHSPHRDSLKALAGLAMDGNLTLLHQGTDVLYNTAIALREVLEELSVCPS
jgi:uncharacterized protein YeaO (DUF488 family)